MQPDERDSGYARILVPLDGSELAEKALPHAQKLARAFGAKVTLLHATSPIETVIRQLTPIDVPVGCDPEEMARIEMEHGNQYLDAVADDLRHHGIEVERVQREGHPADVICQVAREINADIIVACTHGRGGWRHLIFGSVAEETIRHAVCPVLLVHPQT